MLKIIVARVSGLTWSARSPIVSKDGKSIAYLRNSLGLSHFKASQLILYDRSSRKERILVDSVKDPKKQFPGIYCQRLPAQRFCKMIYLNTCWYDFRVR